MLGNVLVERASTWNGYSLASATDTYFILACYCKETGQCVLSHHNENWSPMKIFWDMLKPLVLCCLSEAMGLALLQLTFTWSMLQEPQPLISVFCHLALNIDKWKDIQVLLWLEKGCGCSLIGPCLSRSQLTWGCETVRLPSPADSRCLLRTFMTLLILVGISRRAEK